MLANAEYGNLNINENFILLCSKEAKEVFDVIYEIMNYRNIHSIKKFI